MKKILFIIAAAICSALANRAAAQDTVKANFLKELDYGDTLPYNFIYQKARIGKDTTVTFSATKNILFEVLDNKKDEEFVKLRVSQSNFRKSGSESLDPYMYLTNYVADGCPAEITAYYDGMLSGSSDSLVARSIRNMNFVADTMSRSHFNAEKLSREKLLEQLAYLADTGYVMADFMFGLHEMFFVGAFDLVPDEFYTIKDSAFCNIDRKWHPIVTILGLDAQISRENKDFSNLYVFHISKRYHPMLVAQYYDSSLTEKEAMQLLEKYGENRFTIVEETTILADKAMGLPVLIQTETVRGFYQEIGDNFTCNSKIIVALDMERLISIEEEKEESGEDDQPMYDDYGFIRVK